MDVTAQRQVLSILALRVQNSTNTDTGRAAWQADAYKRKNNMWLLAPHGRATHSFFWQARQRQYLYFCTIKALVKQVNWVQAGPRALERRGCLSCAREVLRPLSLSRSLARSLALCLSLLSLSSVYRGTARAGSTAAMLLPRLNRALIAP
jgi:hypothetical protein